jgi:hypothetical protein
MGRPLFLIAGLLLSSSVPLTAQTVATRISFAQPAPSGSPQRFRVQQASLSLVALSPQLPDKPHPQRQKSFLDSVPPLAPQYQSGHGFEAELQTEEFQTPLLTESSFEVAHLWRGLQFDVFQSTVRSRSLQLGSPMSPMGYLPLGPSINDQAAVTNSVVDNGISLKYTFGRDAQARNPVRVLRCASSIIGHGRGCSL